MKRIGIGVLCLWMIIAIGLIEADSVMAAELIQPANENEIITCNPITESYSVTRDALYQNTSGILFEVLKEGQIISEQEMMKMEFQFLWKEAGKFQNVVVEYNRDGTICITPQFEIVDGILGKLLKWLTVFCVADGSHKIYVSYREPTGTVKNIIYNFMIEKEGPKTSLIYGMVPLIFLIILYGYVWKRRFYPNTQLEITYRSKKDKERIQLCGPIIERELAFIRWRPSGLYSFIPFLSNRKKIGKLTFKAGGLLIARNRHVIIKSLFPLEEVCVMRQPKSKESFWNFGSEKQWKRTKISKGKVRVPYDSRVNIVFKEYPDLVFQLMIH